MNRKRLRSILIALLLLAVPFTACRHAAPSEHGDLSISELLNAESDALAELFVVDRIEEAAIPDSICFFANGKVINFGNPDARTLGDLAAVEPSKLRAELQEQLEAGLEAALRVWRSDPTWKAALAEGSASVYYRQPQAWILTRQGETELLFLPKALPYGTDYAMQCDGAVFSTQPDPEYGFQRTGYHTSHSAAENIDAIADAFFLTADSINRQTIGSVSFDCVTCEPGRIDGIPEPFGRDCVLAFRASDKGLALDGPDASEVLHEMDAQNIYTLAERIYLDEMTFWRYYSEP